MYEEFENLFGDIEKKVKDGNIVINGDININIVGKEEEEKTVKKGKKAVKTLRNSKSIKKWGQKIKTRDGFCQCCGSTEDKLQAHHIFPLAKYSDLGADEGNGIALCDKCHSKYHQMYAGNEDAATFAKFIKDFGGY